MKYYVDNNERPDGHHDVHEERCTELPADRSFLGYFPSCKEAIKEARKMYKKVDGCSICSSKCHTSHHSKTHIVTSA